MTAAVGGWRRPWGFTHALCRQTGSSSGASSGSSLGRSVGTPRARRSSGLRGSRSNGAGSPVPTSRPRVMAVSPYRRRRASAASIAAHHSKARHSKLVPVAYTEKRYVRKPRGSPVGTASMQREKVIFVEPKLPQGLLDD